MNFKFIGEFLSKNSKLLFFLLLITITIIFYFRLMKNTTIKILIKYIFTKIQNQRGLSTPFKI